MKSVVWAMAVAVGAVVAMAQALTADQILERVEEQSFLGTGKGSMYLALEVRVEEPRQAPRDFAFRVWAKGYPDGSAKTLLLYVRPEEVSGTLFLAHLPQGRPSRIWLWLPDLEILKELVGETERKGEFIAGSGFTYEDVARGFTYREGYRAGLTGEETLQGVRVWKLVLTATDPKADWARLNLWVYQGEFIVLRVEFFDRTGKLTRVLTVPELVRDALGLRPARLVMEDVVKGAKATIALSERSAADIPEAYFVPENLAKLKL